MEFFLHFPIYCCGILINHKDKLPFCSYRNIKWILDIRREDVESICLHQNRDFLNRAMNLRRISLPVGRLLAFKEVDS
jgi:hypothetical protein